MPRKSSIKSLPPQILAEVNRLLGGDLATLDEIVAHLEELGHERSRSALGRHKQNLDKVAEKLRRSRDMADALVKEIGPAATEGKTGRLLVEILQNIAFDFLLKRTEGGADGEQAEELASQDFYFLGKSLQALASAQKIDVDRDLAIRKATAKQAAEAVEAVAKSEGLSAETIAKFRSQILGIAQA